jgi:hypothetical protein
MRKEGGMTKEESLAFSLILHSAFFVLPSDCGITSAMAEVTQPGVLATPKKRRKVRVTDIIVFGILLIIIVGLLVTIFNKLSLKAAVNGARPVSDKAIAALQARNGSAAWKLGDKSFQAKNSAANLTLLFKHEEVATLKNPTLDRTIVYNDKTGRTVFFIYKYTALKVPFYIRTGVTKESGGWKLSSLSGSLDESRLIIQ